MENYTGALHHSTAWPDEGVNVRGKRVAIIRQGSTGIQLVQSLIKEAKEMTVFVRTPNMAIPMRQRKISKEEQDHTKGFYDAILHTACRNSFGGHLSNRPPSIDTWSLTPEDRAAWFQENWDRGGFQFLNASFLDALVDEKANREMYDFWAKKSRLRIRDPVKRDFLAPLEPPHHFLTKRNGVEHEYYECMDQDNVHIVDVKSTPIEAFTERGIRIGGAQPEDLEFDVVVCATGFDSYTGALTAMGLEWTDGIDLRQRWKDGVDTHLGLMCPKYPNMWIVYGPQGKILLCDFYYPTDFAAPTALGNGPTIVEVQVEIVVDMITKMRKEGAWTLEPTDSAAKAWSAHLQDSSDASLFNVASSWYMGANVPGKKRQLLNYMKGLVEYTKACNEAMETWNGFEVTQQPIV